MQANDLKLKVRRKARKVIGRGGKKGTYSGRGNKGQKARSGGNINPLFEGGRSTLIDHMKKKRGFRSMKNDNQVIISLEQLEKKFKDGDIINNDSLIKVNLIGSSDRKNKVKILGGKLTNGFSKKITIDKGILFSSSVEKSITKAGGKILIASKKSDLPKEAKTSKK